MLVGSLTLFQLLATGQNTSCDILPHGHDAGRKQAGSMGELTIIGPRVGFGFEGVGFEGMVACRTGHRFLRILRHRRHSVESLTGMTIAHMAHRHCEPALLRRR